MRESSCIASRVLLSLMIGCLLGLGLFAFDLPFAPWVILAGQVAARGMWYPLIKSVPVRRLTAVVDAGATAGFMSFVCLVWPTPPPDDLYAAMAAVVGFIIWWPLLAFSTVLCHEAILHMRQRRRRKHCVCDCGYPRCDGAERCPECGTAYISLADRTPA